MPDKIFLVAASIMGALAVAIGAFGAHALKDLLTANQRLETFETASRYHFYHTLALLVLAFLVPLGSGRWLNMSGHFFIWGTVIFSGTLYLLCITNIRWLGAITPIGGVLLIMAWVLLGLGVYKQL